MWLVVFGALLLVALGASLAEQQKGGGLDLGPMDRWSEKDVGSWLKSIGSAFEAYADAFQKNGINGPSLKTITPHLLDELGVKSHLHQHRILTEINRIP